ncbi:outer membrane protein [Bradyrhizobium sp. HKCCYLS2038]|uniref:outer membrane protein n=1 Tax=unclassified Bradyrhizobium TaxID=2631580 RepID=UPI003EBADEA0
MMRILSAASLVAFITAVAPAFAADLPVKAPAMSSAPPIQFSWSGCHIGGHLGGAFSNDRVGDAMGSSPNYGSSSFIGGGQVGCDYEFSPGWVAGAEVRASWLGLRSTRTGTAINFANGARTPLQFTTRNDFLASATARLGYSVADRWLVFVRGGPAWTRESNTETFTIPGFGVPANLSSPTRTRVGWTVGSGLEWAFAPNWSATFEYNYSDFGTHSVTVFDPATNLFVNGLRVTDTIHAVTTGVNYHF